MKQKRCLPRFSLKSHIVYFGCPMRKVNRIPESRKLLLVKFAIWYPASRDYIFAVRAVVRKVGLLIYSSRFLDGLKRLSEEATFCTPAQIAKNNVASARRVLSGKCLLVEPGIQSKGSRLPRKATIRNLLTRNAESTVWNRKYKTVFDHLMGRLRACYSAMTESFILD